MKQYLALLAVALSCLTGYSQTNNTTSVFRDVLEFATQGSNWMVVPYGIYDLTSDEAGGGIAGVRTFNDYTSLSLRFDYINRELYRPSGSFQVQAPVKLFGKVDVVPFAFAGLAVPFGGSHGGAPSEIFGTGLAVRVSGRVDIIGDYERWDDHSQVRLGVLFKFER